MGDFFNDLETSGFFSDLSQAGRYRPSDIGDRFSVNEKYYYGIVFEIKTITRNDDLFDRIGNNYTCVRYDAVPDVRGYYDEVFGFTDASFDRMIRDKTLYKK